MTVAQYRKFCQAMGREMPPPPAWGWQDNHPIVNVKWEEEAAYAAWAGERLPTELEWEKAARGTDGRRFPWGDRWEASGCVTATNSPGGTQRVGSCPSGASPYRAIDMAGNAVEWCAGWYEEGAYRRHARGDLTAATEGTLKVYRGGSWLAGLPTNFRSAYRGHCLPPYRESDFGFRCVRGPASDTPAK